MNSMLRFGVTLATAIGLTGCMAGHLQWVRTNGGPDDPRDLLYCEQYAAQMNPPRGRGIDVNPFTLVDRNDCMKRLGYERQFIPAEAAR
jgi:hypothetical protein